MSKPRKPRAGDGADSQFLMWESDAELARKEEQILPAERGKAATPPRRDATAAGRDALRTVAAAPTTPSLPDLGARMRIREHLDTSLLVEAGAGAGKTTEMVSRMVALIESGRARIENITAVTFTRKAAGELRERFHIALETRAEASRDDGSRVQQRKRLESAVAEIDRGFIGTIHAFCARVLREHPIEAGLEPGFQELQAVEEARLRRQAWFRHLERLAQENAPVLARLAEVGLKPAQLYSVYESLVDNPDVYFPAAPVPRPDPSRIRARLEVLHDRGTELMPQHEPQGGWDVLQKKIRSDLRYWRHVVRWDDDVAFYNALSTIVGLKLKISKKCWPEHVAADASELCREFDAFAADGSEAHESLMLWLAHRYPIVLELARGAAAAYQAERRRNGWVSFEDLLVLTAELLENSDSARRNLSARFTHLLVDEFQDTDPIQARLLLLLAAENLADKDWRNARPRAGALFVVGDPKQSIYRFRRADILTYNQVKTRFREFGDVVELTANFRSRKPIEAFVNTVFDHPQKFPAEATKYQAAFAPIVVQQEDTPAQGVFWYRNSTAGAGKHVIPDALREDTERVASWIRQRIDAGERTAGSFLILTRHKRFIDAYARALEARSVPVQASGAAVGIDEELSELQLLLKCLADPGDAALVLAVLTGIFFGIDLESLTQYIVDSGGRLTFHSDPETSGIDGEAGGRGVSRDDDAPTADARLEDVPKRERPVSPPPRPASVQAALSQLHDWWLLTKRFPADVAIPKILDDLGLLVYAASGELGETRAGSLVFALDAIRVAALRGDASLSAAIAALDSAYAEDDAEAPLEPGRPDVVRVMNLHKAKGLEADVVILGDPRGAREWDEDRHIVRPPTGEALGYVVVRNEETQKGTRYERTMAQPYDWPELEAEENRFRTAENDRLLYVAATRAREELVISHWSYSNSPSPWAPFYPALMTYPQFELIAMPALRAPARAQVTRTVVDIAAEIAVVERARAAAAAPTYRVGAVTKRLKPNEPPRVFESYGQGRGTRWGSLVHAALQIAGRGVSGEALVEACRGLLASTDAGGDGAAEGLEEIVALVYAMRASPLWQRADASGTALHEVPFGVRFSAEEWAGIRLKLGLPDRSDSASATDPRNLEQGEGTFEIVEGVIDLAFREADGWVLVDFKTDQTRSAAIRAERESLYRKQLDLYAVCWERITGEAVCERRVVFTADVTAA